MNWLTVRDGRFCLVTQQEARHDARMQDALDEWAEAAAHGWEAVEQLLDVYRRRGRVENLRPTVNPEVSKATILAEWNQTTGRPMTRAHAVVRSLDLNIAPRSLLAKIRRWGY